MLMNEYALGIIFSIGSVSEGRLIFRHKSKYFLEQIQALCKNKIYKQDGRTSIQYALKTTYFNIERLRGIGWTDRNSDIRHLPQLNNYKDFLRAYIELHSVLDYCTKYKNKNEKYKALRLRIYGNKELIREVDDILNVRAGVGLKSPQILHNNKTAYIAYTSLGEIKSIFTYIKGKPCFKEFWKDVESKFNSPTEH